MQEHERWLIIAKDDLKSAKVLLKHEVFSTASYHCQQSAEKSLKAYLVFRKQEAVKTHDLIKLLVLCSKFDSNFEKIIDIIEHLNPFSTKFRYPSEYDIPDTEDTQAAIKQANKVLSFVLKKIEEPEIGQINIFNNK